MPDISPSIPVAGQPNSTEEPKIVTALTQIVAAVNDLDSANFAAQQAWQSLTLIAGFSGVLWYYKDALGEVHFRGDSNSNTGSLTGGTTIATMPAGYRPVATVSFPLPDPGQPTVTNVVQITSAGVISAVGSRVGAHAVSFGAVHYRAE